MRCRLLCEPENYSGNGLQSEKTTQRASSNPVNQRDPATSVNQSEQGKIYVLIYMLLLCAPTTQFPISHRHYQPCVILKLSVLIL